MTSAHGRPGTGDNCRVLAQSDSPGSNKSDMTLRHTPLVKRTHRGQQQTAEKSEVLRLLVTRAQLIKGSPYSITERRVPELIPVLGSQPAGDVSHKPSGRLPLLSAMPAVTPATLKRAATNFAAW